MNDIMLCRLLSDGDKEFMMEYSDGSGVPKDGENDDLDIGQDRWRYKYEKKILTWKLLNETADFERVRYLYRAFTVCFRAIGLRCKLKFRRERDISVDTDITIEFTHDLSVFDNRPSVLAQAYLYYPNSRFNGIQQWNDNHYFTTFGDDVNAHTIDPVNYPADTTVKLKTFPLYTRRHRLVS